MVLISCNVLTFANINVLMKFTANADLPNVSTEELHTSEGNQ